MSRSTAWDIAGVSPGARSLAQRAADRAGVPLEQWLDEAIVEHACDPSAMAAAVPVREGPEADMSARPPFAGVRSVRDLQERLKATAGPLTRQTADAAELRSAADPQGTPPAPVSPGPHPSDPPLRDERRAGPEAFDLQSALSQIASRRRALDARLAHDGFQAPPAGPSSATGPVVEAPVGAERGAQEFPADLRSAFRDLPGRPDAPKPDLRGARLRAREFEAIEDEARAATRRADPIALPRLAPGDLAPNGRLEPAASATPGLDESLLASVSRIALDLRDALAGAGPAPVAALDRRIDALGAKIDALAGSVVREEVVEAVRRQMEAVRDLLIAAARRSLPLQRLDEQLSRLVDQVERLTAGPPSLDAMQANELIALLRRPAGTPAPDPDRGSIDGRLAEIAGRLDEDGAVIRASLAAIAARLDAAQPDSRAGVGHLGTIAGSADSADRLADAIARRLETLFEGRGAPPAATGRLAQIASRLDGVAGRLEEIEALERAARDALDRLRTGDQPRAFDAVEEIAALRSERSAADQRAEALLRGVQDVLDRLVERLPGEADRSSFAGRRGDARAPAIRIVDPATVASLDTIDRPRPAAPGDRAVDRDPTPGARSGDDVLLEPGTSGPERAEPSSGPGQTAGARTSPAVSAHIAAARRAAQSSVVGSGGEAAPAWPNVERNVRHAGRFCAAHKRSILVAVALALALAAAARLLTDHAFVARLAGTAEAPAPAPATGHPSAPGGGAGAPARAPAAIDTSPTGSIGRDRASPAPAGAGPAPAATVPAGLPPPLRDAVLAGSPAAEYELAQRLVDGRGLDRDPAAAAVWFERAASAGLAPAAFRLGALYQKGVGVPRDPAAARRWYTAAALAGNARAAHNLGVLDAEPADDRADYAEAARWFRKAAQMGVRDSQFNLGVLAARGLGVEPDLRQAWLWFSLAAAQGDAEAGRKRDEVAARMDPDALAAAAALLAQFKPVPPDPAANDVAPAPGRVGGTPADRDARDGAKPAGT